MTSISKMCILINQMIEQLDDRTYHRTIKMKLVDVKQSKYLDSSKEINDKDPRFKICDIVRISKYNSIFARGYVPNWSNEVFFY